MFNSQNHNQMMSYMFENQFPRAEDGLYQLDFGGPSNEQQQQQPEQQQQQQPNQRPKKRTNHSLTQEQIGELEAFFNMKDHPNERERKELGNRLQLDPSKIKFWFQNKRTKLKAQSQRDKNQLLKIENEFLRAENENLKVKMNRYKDTPITCNCCGTRAAIVMPNNN